MALIDKYPKLAEIMHDPKKKTVAGLMLLGIALFIGLIIYNSVSSKEKKKMEVKIERSALPNIIEGESGDNLENTSMLSAHENSESARRRAGRSGRDIWESSAPDISEDLDLNTENAKNKKIAEQDGMSSPGEDAMAFFGVSTKKEETEPVTTTPTSSYSGSSGTSTGGRKYASTEDRMKAADDYLVSQGIDPKTGLPIETPQEPEKEEEVKQEEAHEPEIRVTSKRTGGISSLEDDFSSSLDNLDSQEEYITEDMTHPYKVMFIRDQKISSGDRVTLRLLEDLPFNGVLIPANTHLQATATISDRLELSVTSIEMNGKLYTMSYTAYDNDGGKGLYCPDTAAGKNVKDGVSKTGQIVSSALQTGIVGMAGRVVSSGTQLIQSNTGNVRVSLTSGYQFFLMREKK